MKRLQGIGFERVGRWLLNNEGLDFEIDRFADKTNILYAFICSGAVKYVGKSTKSLQTRMGQYRNPGSDQITNIGNNRRILETLHRGIDVEIYVLPDNGLTANEKSALLKMQADGMTAKDATETLSLYRQKHQEAIDKAKAEAQNA